MKYRYLRSKENRVTFGDGGSAYDPTDTINSGGGGGGYIYSSSCGGCGECEECSTSKT